MMRKIIVHALASAELPVGWLGVSAINDLELGGARILKGFCLNRIVAVRSA